MKYITIEDIKQRNNLVYLLLQAYEKMFTQTQLLIQNPKRKLDQTSNLLIEKITNLSSEILRLNQLDSHDIHVQESYNLDRGFVPTRTVKVVESKTSIIIIRLISNLSATLICYYSMCTLFFNGDHEEFWLHITGPHWYEYILILSLSAPLYITILMLSLLALNTYYDSILHTKRMRQEPVPNPEDHKAETVHRLIDQELQSYTQELHDACIHFIESIMESSELIEFRLREIINKLDQITRNNLVNQLALLDHMSSLSEKTQKKIDDNNAGILGTRIQPGHIVAAGMGYLIAKSND